jgi:hypothetical protein
VTAKLLTRMDRRQLQQRVVATVDQAPLGRSAVVEELKQVLARTARNDQEKDAAA